MPGKRFRTSSRCIATAGLAVLGVTKKSKKFKMQREKRQCEQYLTSPPLNPRNHDSQRKRKSKRARNSYQVTRHPTRVCKNKPCPARCWAWIIHGNFPRNPWFRVFRQQCDWTLDERRLGPSSHNRNRPRGTRILVHGDGRGSGRNVG